MGCCASLLNRLHSVPLLASTVCSLGSQPIIERSKEERARDTLGNFNLTMFSLRRKGHRDVCAIILKNVESQSYLSIPNFCKYGLVIKGIKDTKDSTA